MDEQNSNLSSSDAPADRPKVIAPPDPDAGARIADSAAPTIEPRPASPSVEEPPETQFGNRLPFIYFLPFLVPLVFFCFLLPLISLRIQSVLQYPYELDGEEGFVFNQAVQLYLGKPIYTSLEHEPYLVGNYPPLFPWIISRFISPEATGLQLGRLIVVFSSILILQLLAVISFLRTRRILFAFLTPLLFLMTYEFHNWSGFCRVDFTALAFTLMGLFFYLAIQHRSGTFLAALFFILAAFTRQTAILAPAACSLAMLIHDRRRLGWFLIPYVGLGLGSFFVLNTSTGGEFFRHVIQYNRNEMNWLQWRKVMQNEIWFFYRWWICGMAVGGVTLVLAFLSRTQEVGLTDMSPPRHARAVILSYAILGAFALLLFAKVGSAPNYALEPLAAFAIFSMQTAGRLSEIGSQAPSRQRRWARLGLALMGAAFCMHAVHVRNNARWMFSTRNPDDFDKSVGSTVLAVVQRTEGDVLSEFPMFSIRSGKPVLYQPFIMSRLAREGMWDEKKFTAMIESHRFSLIITSQDLNKVRESALRFTLEMVDSILDYYEIGYVFGQDHKGGLGQMYYIWVPAPRPSESGSKKHMNIA